MYKKIALSLLSILLICVPSALAKDQLACYELDLFGYRIGMSYEDAVNIRNFQHISHSEEEAVGVVDGLKIDETDFSVKVHFKNDRVFKIVSRFDPGKVETVADSIKNALGQNQDNSKVRVAGTNVSILTHFCWINPKTRVDVVRVSDNNHFATLSMLPNNTHQAHM